MRPGAGSRQGGRGAGPGLAPDEGGRTRPGGQARRTAGQRAGDLAEDVVAERLVACGWTILGRNVRAGRSELDIVAVDPGPPRRLVVVEVRWRRSRTFGGAEESLDRHKRASLARGVGRLLETGHLPDGRKLPHLPLALDLATVEPGPRGSRVTVFRDALS